jgi:hypothetical protein
MILPADGVEVNSALGKAAPKRSPIVTHKLHRQRRKPLTMRVVVEDGSTCDF